MSATTTTGTQIVARHQRVAGGALLEIELLAREAGLHPELVRRFVALGLLDDADGHPGLFWRDAAARLARAGRLRRDLGLNYAGAVLACELLERIERLEARLRRYEPDFDMNFDGR
ncbi:MAG TPA: chaperone modulator CbpM [Solirubrobacterales bacterium]|nr:chaperone modulator CbpM [Solirubrobacterales bacterium]